METEKICEYFSEDNTKRADVYNGDIPYVDFFDRGTLVESRSFPGHNYLYAEDAAENFVNGVLKFD